MGDKILVVDDEIETLRLVGLTLQRQGYQIVAASNGMQALDMTRSERPDLIIMDVMMPDMDGFEVTRRLRSDMTMANVPILMFSARAQLDDKVTGYEAGADDYLTKPIHPTELVAHVKALLMRSKEQSNTVSHVGYMVACVGAQGGCGVSTLALNLAISFQRKLNLQVIAAELNPGRSAWPVERVAGVPDGLGNLLRCKADEMTVSTIENELYQSNFGPRLLLSSNHLHDVELFKSTLQVEYLVQQLPRMSTLVLLDMGVIQWPNYEKILSACNEIVVVFEPYTASVDRTRLLINELTELETGNNKALTMVSVNPLQTDHSLGTVAIQDKLQQPVAQFISPAAEQAYYAEAMRTPLVMSHPDSLVSRQIHQLADMIASRVTQQQS